MYFTAYEALESRDLSVLARVLKDIQRERGITIDDPISDVLARDLVNLWHAGFRGYDELKAMLRPLDDHLVDGQSELIAPATI